MSGLADLPDLGPLTRGQWRAWLQEHHDASSGVWLAVQKKGSPSAAVRYPDAVEEALCFGWIDSTVRSLDADSFRQVFTPRKPGSIWAPSNKERVARLTEAGLMAPAGLAVIEVAKANGQWTAYDAIAQLSVPADLATALAANPEAERRWQAFSASAKKAILYFVQSAKRPQTRATRIQRTVELAEQNLRIGIDRR
jgi:uncharacterized protein YdeI (YjbR/CyaY-like superfamily)